MLAQIAQLLSYALLPLLVICVVDDWFLRPRRQRAALPGVAQDTPLMRTLYFALMIAVLGGIYRLMTSEDTDYSLVLFIIMVVSGAVWLIDALFLRKQRQLPTVAADGAPAELPEPGTVDYARSFFPVAFIVLVVRAFIFEPFRIPSDSMMPTLLDGDFIVVNKYAYGLRWPVINQKFMETGEPQRGDVVVFRHPPHPEVNFIKRLVGLPGDRIEVHDDHLVINGETIELKDEGRYNDGCYANVRLSTEKLGEHTHQVMSCRSTNALTPAKQLVYQGIASPTEACDRKGVVEKWGGYVCLESPPEAGRDSGNYELEVVPAGFYLMIGDNRDNSDDGRSWGLVPDKNLVGKATRIWFNFDSQRPLPKVVNWRRIGSKID